MKNITITKPSTVKAIGKVRNGNSKPVFCITTGEIYTSATDAAEQLKVSQATLCLAASGKIKTCKGNRYCYVKDIIPNLNEICENARARATKVAAYDKIVGKQQRKAELEARKSKLAIMQAKMEKEAALIAQEEAALAEV